MPPYRAVIRSRIASIVPGASFCVYRISTFGEALFCRYFTLYDDRPVSPWMSRITGVSHDIPRNDAAGSGTGHQCATSSVVKNAGSPYDTPSAVFGGSNQYPN